MEKYKNTTDIIVVGSGPSGLMSAVTAAKKGRKVLVLEQKDVPCKKIYATGNGRCNFTNLYVDEKVFRGEQPKFAYDAYERFDNSDLIGFINELGVITKDINGYVYPYNEQASTIASCLLFECKRLGILIRCSEKVVDITKDDGVFEVTTTLEKYRCKNVVIAVGGKASPSHGSDGNLNKVIRKLGHDIILQRSALVPLLTDEKKFSTLAGVRIKCSVTLFVNEKPVNKESGEIIFNKDNISGIPVMQLSRYAVNALAENKRVSLELDMFDQIDTDELCKLISKNRQSDISLCEALGFMINDKLARFVTDMTGYGEKTQLNSLSDNDINRLGEILKHFKVDIFGDSGFNRAQVTLGGVDTTQIDENMQSVIVKGLYFVGEILDVDGTCGGYNLQWAFTSGHIAGESLS